MVIKNKLKGMRKMLVNIDIFLYAKTMDYVVVKSCENCESYFHHKTYLEAQKTAYDLKESLIEQGQTVVIDYHCITLI